MGERGTGGGDCIKEVSRLVDEPERELLWNEFESDCEIFIEELGRVCVKLIVRLGKSRALIREANTKCIPFQRPTIRCSYVFSYVYRIYDDNFRRSKYERNILFIVRWISTSILEWKICSSSVCRCKVKNLLRRSNSSLS